MILIKDLFPDVFNNGGVFTIIREMFTLPWSKEFDKSIDIEFILTYGDMHASRLAYTLLEHYTGRVLNDNDVLVEDDGQRYVITKQGLYEIAKIVYNRYALNWTKLYNTLTFEYNPIENYSMLETETGEINNNNQLNNSTSNNSKSNRQGFNSNNYTPVDEVVATGTGNSTEINVNKHERTLKRSGNIGVTTSQQMIESERQLWMYDYFKGVYENVVNVIGTGFFKSY